MRRVLGLAAVVASAGMALPLACSGAAQAQAPETVVQPSTHEVIRANTLWDLAQYYYKDPFQWPRIHEANKDKVKDPHWIYPGQQLIIPGFDKTVTVARKEPGAAPEVVQPKEDEPAPEPRPAPSSAAEEPQAPAETLPPVAEAPGLESLSAQMPEGLVGQPTSETRKRLAKDWAPDGKVLLSGGRDSVAGIGDQVMVRFGRGYDLHKGQPLTVYRRAGPTEADKDKDGKTIPGTYLARVGVIEVDRKLAEDEYRAVVVQASGAVQSGDILVIGQE